MAYRSDNPLSAFLAGFETVNRLEDARDQRAWNKTQRSRIRKLWDREDEEYSRVKLDNYRKEKAFQFDMISKDVLGSAADRIKSMTQEFNNPKVSEDRRAELRKQILAEDEKWFGSKKKESLVNEVFKRMIAADPSFGEHVASAFGRDPAAGPLVRDPKRPVSGVVFAPPGHGGFEGGITYEIDATTGKWGMTKNRTSAKNDEIVFDQPNMQALTGVFGIHAIQAQTYDSLNWLYEELGGNNPTGNPLPEQDRKQAQGGAASGAADSKAGAANSKAGATTTETPDTTNTSPAKTEQEAFDERLRQQHMERVKAGDTEGIPEDVLSDLEARLKKSYGDQFRTRAEADALIAELGPRATSRTGTGGQSRRTIQTGLISDTPTDGGGVLNAIGGTIKDIVGAGSVGEAAEQVGTNIRESAGSGANVASDYVKKVGPYTPGYIAATKIAPAYVEGVKGLVKGLSGAPDTLDKALESEEELNAVANAQGVDPKDFAADTEEKGQANSVAAPASGQAAADIGNSVIRNQSSGSPPNWQVYKAYQMQQAGMISPEELRRFKRTGKLEAPAEYKFQSVGDGNWIVTQNGLPVMQGTHPNAGGAGGGDKPATVQDHAALQALYEKYTQDIEDPGYQQSVIGAMQGAATILGAGNRSKQDLADRANISVSSMLRGGMNLINRFDEDTIQGLWDAGNIDWTWGDFEIDMNAGNIAVASEIYMSKVGDKKQIAHALRDYTRDFKGIFPGMSDQRLAYRTGQIEQKIKQGISMAQQSGKGVIPVEGGKSVTVEKGDTPHEVRQKIFEVLKGN